MFLKVETPVAEDRNDKFGVGGGFQADLHLINGGNVESAHPKPVVFPVFFPVLLQLLHFFHECNQICECMLTSSNPGEKKPGFLIIWRGHFRTNSLISLKPFNSSCEECADASLFPLTPQLNMTPILLSLSSV